MNFKQPGADPLIFSINIGLLLIVDELVESLQLLRFMSEFVVFVFLVVMDAAQLAIENVIFPIDHQ